MPPIKDNQTRRFFDAGRPAAAAATPSRQDAYPAHAALCSKAAGDDARRVLVVDDDTNILRLVAKMVMRLGYHPTAAEDAMEALYHLARTHYRLVLTDYKMPFMDGGQLAERVKAEYFATRVIVMTGHCEAEVAGLLDGTGVVDGLLLKPFNLQTLKAKIQALDYPADGTAFFPSRGPVY
jgi:CheY-like chemotaxis protein